MSIYEKKYLMMLMNSLNDETKKSVSIQGYEGSFHQMAAEKYFGEHITVIPCATFRDVIKIAEDKKQRALDGAEDED